MVNHVRGAEHRRLARREKQDQVLRVRLANVEVDRPG
jgi:hypothetical protein